MTTALVLTVIGLDKPGLVEKLSDVIAGDKARFDWLRSHLVNGDWFTTSLPPILDELRQARNPAAHTEKVDREQIVRLRNGMIGVGEKGSLLELTAVKLK